MVGKKELTDEVFAFLKKALVTGSFGKSAHRGLDGFSEGDYMYKNIFTEKRGFVEGEEQIFYKGQLIYIQVYHGGALEENRIYKDWSKQLLSSKDLKKQVNF